MNPVAPRSRFVILFSPDHQQNDKDDQDSDETKQRRVSLPVARPSFLVEQWGNHDPCQAVNHPLPSAFRKVPSLGLISKSPFTSLSCRSSSKGSTSPKSSRTLLCAAGDSFGETF